MAEPANLARHLKTCFRDDRLPRLNAGDAKLWFLALAVLVRQGALEEAAFAARHLTSAFPESHYFAHQAMLLETMPAAVADTGFSSFSDYPEQAVQIVRRRGASALLLAFCGIHGALGLPLPIAHRWFGSLGAHVVYLRDPPGGFFDDGVPALAQDRSGTEQALEAIAETLQATNIMCYGNSTGGYAALLYGLKMGAASVLAVNTVVVAPDRAKRVSTSLPRCDLRTLYQKATSKPLTRLVYAANNDDDHVSALAMSGISGITIEPVPDCSAHDAHVKLIEQGRFGPLLRDTLLRECEGAS